MTNSNKTKVLLCDDHAVFRLGLRVLLERAESFIVEEAERADRAAEIATEFKPDLVVVDYLLPDQNGLALIQSLMTKGLKFKSVLLTNVEEEAIQNKCRELGLQGCLFKSQPIEQVLNSLLKVVQGEEAYSATTKPVQQVRAGESNPFARLTPRELEIVRKIAKGLTQKQIAQELNISVRTLEKHRSNITDKMGKMTPAELTRQAYAWGIISDPGLTSGYR
ncbi:MAG: response regulator transcription factor [Spirochaetia bacterium]|nr:response regulator transcription factor [Spirochaetia bacterium]